MKLKTPTTFIVNAFDCKDGHVPAHEIIRQNPRAKSSIEFIVFSTFDHEADMIIEVLVRWYEFTKWTKKKDFNGQIKAVIMCSGERIHAEGISVGHNNDKSYLSAPIICRNTYLIRTLCTYAPLIEIVGVGEWIYSKRDEAATAKYLIDPVARDKAAYEVAEAA